MITDLHEKFDVLLQNEGDHECEGIGKDKVCVRVVAMAELPTRFGEFHIIAFENNRDGKEHVAIIKGDVIPHTSRTRGKTSVYTRSIV